MKKFALLILMGMVFLLAGCSQQPELREAAYCKPYSEYEIYDTQVVYSVSDIPLDCKSLLVSNSEKIHVFYGMDEEERYYDNVSYILSTMYYMAISEPMTECFAYQLIIPEEAEDTMMDELDTLLASLDLQRFAACWIPVQSMEVFSHMEHLESLWIAGIDTIKPKFTGDFPALTDLHIEWTNLTRLGDIVNITTLQRLEIIHTSLRSIKGIEQLTNLSKLALGDNKIRSFAPLQTMTQLTALGIDMNEYEVDLRYLEGLQNLKSLGINHHFIRQAVKHIQSIQKLTELEHLSMEDCGIDSVEVFRDLTELRTLVLTANEVEDLTPLANLTNLEKLKLHNNKISDLTPISALTSLKLLYIGNNPITDISVVAMFPELEDLSVCYLHITDLSQLADLKHLKVLDINYTPVEDIQPLYEMVSLRNVDARNCYKIDKDVLHDYGEWLTNQGEEYQFTDK